VNLRHPKLVEGGLLADVIMVNASLDIVLGEIDRVSDSEIPFRNPGWAGTPASST
jgi:hypothetical protein